MFLTQLGFFERIAALCNRFMMVYDADDTVRVDGLADQTNQLSNKEAN